LSSSPLLFLYFAASESTLQDEIESLQAKRTWDPPVVRPSSSAQTDPVTEVEEAKKKLAARGTQQQHNTHENTLPHLASQLFF
jgi:hypothetical protein